MNKIWKLCTPVFVAVVMAANALAADDGFKPNPIEGKGGWIKWVATVGFSAALFIAAFKNPRRTHLD